MKWAWIFQGEGARVCSAAFSSQKRAEDWIRMHSLTGTLRRFPIDISVYDYAIEEGFFKPTTQDKKSGAFMQSFTSAYLEHYHYENGKSEKEA